MINLVVLHCLPYILVVMSEVCQREIQLVGEWFIPNIPWEELCPEGIIPGAQVDQTRNVHLCAIDAVLIENWYMIKPARFVAVFQALVRLVPMFAG
jgi:hypothetical protein